MECSHTWSVPPPTPDYKPDGPIEWARAHPILAALVIVFLVFTLSMCVKTNFIDPQRCSWEDAGVGGCPTWEDYYENM
jgi:hypothetical protein